MVLSKVMKKAIAHPTDSALMDSSREHLVKAVRPCSLHLRKKYAREARLAQQVGRYVHAEQFRRMPVPCAPRWTRSPQYFASVGAGVSAKAQATR